MFLFLLDVFWAWQLYQKGKDCSGRCHQLSPLLKEIYKLLHTAVLPKNNIQYLHRATIGLGRITNREIKWPGATM